MVRNWLILTALAMEAKAIAAELGLERPLTARERVYPHAVSSDARIQLRIVGVKAKHFITPSILQGFNSIMLAGLAGALDPALSIGDLILDGSIEMFEELKDTATKVASPGLDFVIRRGKILTTDHIIAAVTEKESLFRSTGCAAVDMEGQIVREIADAAKVPMIHLRAISDTAADALPGNLPAWIDDFGNPRLPKVAADLALHPQQIPAMIRLGKNSKVAVRNLAKAVRQIIERG